MASQTQGIQQLLAAEKRAAEKVAEARKSKCFVNTNSKELVYGRVFRSIDFQGQVKSHTYIAHSLSLCVSHCKNVCQENSIGGVGVGGGGWVWGVCIRSIDDDEYIWTVLLRFVTLHY